MSSLKEYGRSSLITFIATFSAAVVPSIGDLQFTKAAVIALVLVGVRAGIKAVFEIMATIAATPIPPNA